MSVLVKYRRAVVSGIFLLVFLITGCAPTNYIYQNGTTYNDYEVATNYRIKNATKRPKVQYSKSPNWKKVSNRHYY
jgi:hypothetical protein